MGPIKPILSYNLAITHSFSFFHADQQNKKIGLCQIVTYHLSHWLQSPGLKVLLCLSCLRHYVWSRHFTTNISVLWSRYFYPYSPLKRSSRASAALSGSCGPAAKIIFETPCTSGDDLHKALEAISGQQLGRPSYYWASLDISFRWGSHIVGVEALAWKNRTFCLCAFWIRILSNLSSYALYRKC